MIVTERRIVRQTWYETEFTKTGWDNHGWEFNDTGHTVDENWNIVKYLETDKYGNPMLGIAEKETEII